VVKSSKPSDKEIAYHESGHAVVSVLLRYPVKNVTIIPDGDTLGCINHCDTPTRIQEDLELLVQLPSTKRWVFRAMMAYYAGQLAQERVTNRHPIIVFKEGCSYDFEELTGLAKSSWRNGYQEQIDQAGEEARRLLEIHWEAVKAVAEALLERKRLSGKYVRKIVAENGGRAYILRGGLSKCYKKSEEGELVEHRPTLKGSEVDIVQEIWREAPITVELWKKGSKK